MLTDDTLSAGANFVLRDVLAVMQNADELGGTEDVADYQALMIAIASEALRRARMAAELER